MEMSYAELDAHPRKHSLMRTAFTLQSGIDAGREIIKADMESKAKVRK